MKSSFTILSHRQVASHGTRILAAFVHLKTRLIPPAACVLAGFLAGCDSPTASAGSSPSTSSGNRVAATAALPSEHEPNPVPQAAPKSVFRTGADAGRDPFYAFAAPTTDAAPEMAAPARLPLISYLKLVGIRAGTTRPMALINRTSLCPGEEADVSIVVSNQFSQAEVQKVSVKCLEVRRESVLISIAGEQGIKELRMAKAK